MSAAIRHRTIETNGIRMHVAEAGEGFPVVFCHGFPELWYSWRHQLPALAGAGFHAIAPDMRGYGRTDAPAEPADYRMSVLAADMAGLLDALGLEKAVFVGHDWGGALIWQVGLRYPGRVERLVGVNTPYFPPAPERPTAALAERWGSTSGHWYMLYFQEPGVAEAELEADVRGNLAKVFHPASRAEDLWTFATVGGDGSGVLTKVPPGNSFLSGEELDVYAREFERTGFRGGLNWYRAMDLSWEESLRLPSHTIDIPSLMITAENDLILRPELAEPMRQWVPNLRIELVRNCSHWTQQERPGEVNRLLLDFLGDLARR
jgi:soluble epoxide hydrolase/lipid-phosphate phosphatase